VNSKNLSETTSALGLGQVISNTRIYQGDWAAVRHVTTDTGCDIAVKCPSKGYEWLAEAEGRMLEFIAGQADIPVPEVLGIRDDMLLLGFIANDGRRTDEAQREAGRYLAMLHGVSATQFGFDHDTIFGPTRQPNARSDDWVAFFREQRLAHMAEIAHEAGRIDSAMLNRLQRLLMNLEDYIPPPARPALVHGDFWGGNVLYRDGHCAAFIDPAIYFGHPEVDLSFATLFGSVGRAFFDGYNEVTSIEAGFEQRIDIYNLWPLLFHAYWFGGSYAQQVDGILRVRGF
jgi:fructosamine-3-kinase